MGKVLAFLKHEINEAVFPFLFFFVVFHFGIASKMLLLNAYELKATAVASATVGAFIVAKAILVVDALPFEQHFSRRPLIYRILVNSVIYSIMILLFRYLEELIPFWWEHGSFIEANQHLKGKLSWPSFWVIQMWLVASVLCYSMISALGDYFGRDNVRKALFTIPRQQNSN